jgi:hypothetical protein
MISSLSRGNVLPGLSVSALTTGYEQNISELYSHLSAKERSCLHVIYERLRVADDVASNVEERLLKLRNDPGVTNPFKVCSNALSEMLESYDVVEDLIRSYLSGKPTDVFHLEASS